MLACRETSHCTHGAYGHGVSHDCSRSVTPEGLAGTRGLLFNTELIEMQIVAYRRESRWPAAGAQSQHEIPPPPHDPDQQEFPVRREIPTREPPERREDPGEPKGPPPLKDRMLREQCPG